jgi:opacity protein-like surface antigen
MKNLALAVITAVASSSALAGNMYVEGQLGMHSVDVSTKSYSGTAAGITFTNVKADMDYDTATSMGVELGAYMTDNIRLGYAFTTMNADFDSATISGTATDGTTTISGSGTIKKSDFPSIGSTFDNKVKLYEVKGYYDFVGEGATTPFIGAGIGFADIENAKDMELAMSLTAGVNVDIAEDVYMGISGSLTSIQGPTDELGIEFDDMTVTSGRIVIGKRF